MRTTDSGRGMLEWSVSATRRMMAFQRSGVTRIELQAATILGGPGGRGLGVAICLDCHRQMLVAMARYVRPAPGEAYDPRHSNARRRVARDHLLSSIFSCLGR